MPEHLNFNSKHFFSSFFFKGRGYLQGIELKLSFLGDEKCFFLKKRLFAGTLFLKEEVICKHSVQLRSVQLCSVQVCSVGKSSDQKNGQSLDTLQCCQVDPFLRTCVRNKDLLAIFGLFFVKKSVFFRKLLLSVKVLDI